RSRREEVLVDFGFRISDFGFFRVSLLTSAAAAGEPRFVCLDAGADGVQVGLGNGKLVRFVTQADFGSEDVGESLRARGERIRGFDDGELVSRFKKRVLRRG